jgi:hypothetical protein
MWLEAVVELVSEDFLSSLHQSAREILSAVRGRTKGRAVGHKRSQ